MRTYFPFFICLPLLSSGQELVSTSPQDRIALMEDFVAIHCGYCPAGRIFSDSLQAAHPDKFVVVGVHSGGLADPSAGEPDFRTVWGPELRSFFNVNAQPRGVINRHAVNGVYGLSRTGWASAVNNILAQPSPVNIGMASAFDAESHLLTVNVELYYTGDSPGGNDYVTVLLQEDHIIGYQQDWDFGPWADYDHENVLRAIITPTWGDEVSTTTTGSFVERTYTFTVPEQWNIDNCTVVAFIGEYQGEVYQAKEVSATDGTTTSISALTAKGIPLPWPVPADEQVFIPLSSSEARSTIRVTDNLGRVVISERSSSDKAELDVRAWPTGVYSFNISNATGVRTGRFVVQR